MPRTIGHALEWHAIYTPDRLAVFERMSSPDGAAGVALTYSDLWTRVCKLSNALLALGIRPGDRVATLMVNSARYVEVYHAIAVIGAAAVPLNFRFVAAEIEYIVNHAGAKALIFDLAFAPVLKQLDGRLPSVGTNLVASDGALPGRIAYEELIENAQATRPDMEVDPDGCFFQGYTAGTTGFPKGCVNLHGRFTDFFKRTALLYRIGRDDVELVPAPLFHEAPTLFMMTQVFRGGTVVVTRETDPASILGLIEAHSVTWAFMVPTMWDSLVNSGLVANSDVSSMRVLISAGAPLQTHTKNGLLDLFPRADLNEFYGGTEVGIVTNLSGSDQRRKVRSVGRPIPGFHVRLADANGEDVPSGQTGEIYIRGPILIREYFNNPEATETARKGEWFSLGDMGRFDDEGYLYVVDRKKDMIITGGENVFPAEIEAVLYQHPGVSMAAVVGIPDPTWGEIIYAAVVLKDGESVSESSLAAHCGKHLARFKVPKVFAFVDQLPTSSFGKILRREVRKPFWEGKNVAV